MDQRKQIGGDASHGPMAETLAKVSGILVQVRDTHLLSQRIVDELRSMFGTLGVMFCRLDPHTQSLHAIAVSGDVGPEYDTHVVFAAGMGAPGLAAVEPKPVILPDVLADTRVRLTPEMRSVISRAPFRAVLAIPVILEAKIIGTLCLLDRPGRLFTQDEAWFAQAVAHQAALALENARLYEEAERHRAAAEAAQAEAVTANQAKDVFIATLSHELRTLLNAAFGWTRLLRTGQIDKAAMAHGLEAIERNCWLQARLVDDVLDIARIITGKLQLTTKAVELSTVIEQSIESLARGAEEKGVILAVKIEPNTGTVDGDPLRLHQIVTNLVSNGIKFTPRSGRVEVRLERHGAAIRITVTDTGRGITSDLLPHVFDRFRQQEVERGGAGGLGLGLGIVRHLVELHRGTVAAESRGTGLGATFTVDLPALPEA
jgi:signal transduction histidine kinase